MTIDDKPAVVRTRGLGDVSYSGAHLGSGRNPVCFFTRSPGYDKIEGKIL